MKSYEYCNIVDKMPTVETQRTWFKRECKQALSIVQIWIDFFKKEIVNIVLSHESKDMQESILVQKNMYLA